MQPVHVMHIRDGRGIFGAERVILALLKNYDRKEFKISLLCMKRGDGASNSLIEEARNLGVSVFTVDIKGKLDLSGILKIRRLFQSEKVSIFHSHDFKSDFYGWLASQGLKVQRIATAHGSTRDSLRKKFYLLFNEKVIWRQFHKIITVSKELEADLLDAGLSKKQVVTVRNGLDFSTLECRLDRIMGSPIPPQCKGRKVFAVIGRLYPDKGHIIFLDAFAKVIGTGKDICALVVGDGPFRTHIEAHVNRLGLNQVIHMLGVRSDMGRLYKDIDCLVIPSLREGLPYVLLEAMAMEVNVIATKVGEIPSIIEDGVNGLLVSPGDATGLAKSIESYLEKNEFHSNWKALGKEKILREFSAESMTRNIESIYRHSSL
ncbi:MAG: glycosyltransferase [Syntrophotaleaceae bacterium]